jgi:hypothetical protein
MLLSISDISKKYNIGIETARTRINKAGIKPAKVVKVGCTRKNIFNEVDIVDIVSVAVRRISPLAGNNKPRVHFDNQLCVQFIRGGL